MENRTADGARLLVSEQVGKCGVDEAGRGPVLGPLVVAAVMVQDEAPLRKMGVRDSKMLSRIRRSDLFDRITELADFEVVVLTHQQIDEQRRVDSLNEIEARAFATAVRQFTSGTIYLDAADVDATRFGTAVSRYLDHDARIISRHKADELFPVVSAASIIAKETRDRMMDRIGEEMGMEVGSGYAHDPKTLAFLENWISENGDLPPCARRSWGTSRRLLGLSKTRRLTDWVD